MSDIHSKDMRTRNDNIGKTMVTRGILCISLMLSCTSAMLAGDKVKPYKGYTGTVHQFGFVGGVYNTANPNFSADEHTQTFHDYGLGASYTMHDYVTRQFTFDLTTSVTVITAKSLEVEGSGDSKQKIVWPVESRFYLGPSEDFQAYIGTGLQWNMLEKTTGEYDIITGSAPSKTIHQLSGNTTVGLNFFGPQNYMFHLNFGAKFHYPISDNDDIETDGSLVDLTKDRSCIILNGGVTIDIDRKKNACVMLNYEYPLGSPKSRYQGGSGSFWKRTQTISLGLMFHIGGTRK